MPKRTAITTARILRSQSKREGRERVRSQGKRWVGLVEVVSESDALRTVMSFRECGFGTCAMWSPSGCVGCWGLIGASAVVGVA